MCHAVNSTVPFGLILFLQALDSCVIVDPAKGSYGEANFRISDTDGLTTEDEVAANNQYRSLAHFTPAPPGNNFF